MTYDEAGADAGNDYLDGGSGNDKLYGGAGNDHLIGGSGADKLYGDGGIDTADYSDSKSGVTASLATGTGLGGDAQGDTLSGIENLIGSKRNDILTGNDDANVIKGGNGDDVLNGGKGDDKLFGGNGKDVLNGGEDNDKLFGGNDKDILNGAGGNDWLFGGKGSDTLTGGLGEDILVGGKGGDILTGGNSPDGAKDHFVYSHASDSPYDDGDADGWDVITDFENGIDKIDLRKLTDESTLGLAWWRRHFQRRAPHPRQTNYQGHQ